MAGEISLDTRGKTFSEFTVFAYCHCIHWKCYRTSDWIDEQLA